MGCDWENIRSRGSNSTEKREKILPHHLLVTLFGRHQKFKALSCLSHLHGPIVLQKTPVHLKRTLLSERQAPTIGFRTLSAKCQGGSFRRFLKILSCPSFLCRYFDVTAHLGFYRVSRRLHRRGFQLANDRRDRAQQCFWMAILPRLQTNRIAMLEIRLRQP